MMERLGHTAGMKTNVNKQQVRENRALWKELGFRLITAQAHDDDRALVLAQLDTLKHDRLASMTERSDTSVDDLRVIATRNMLKALSPEDIAAIKEAAGNSTAKEAVLASLESYRHYLRKRVNVRNNYDEDASYDTKTRMQAKDVAFMNAALAHYRLACEQLNHADALSVFNLQNSPAGGQRND